MPPRKGIFTGKDPKQLSDTPRMTGGDSSFDHSADDIVMMESLAVLVKSKMTDGSETATVHGDTPLNLSLFVGAPTELVVYNTPDWTPGATASRKVIHFAPDQQSRVFGRDLAAFEINEVNGLAITAASGSPLEAMLQAGYDQTYVLVLPPDLAKACVAVEIAVTAADTQTGKKKRLLIHDEVQNGAKAQKFSAPIDGNSTLTWYARRKAYKFILGSAANGELNTSSVQHEEYDRAGWSAETLVALTDVKLPAGVPAYTAANALKMVVQVSNVADLTFRVLIHHDANTAGYVAAMIADDRDPNSDIVNTLY